MTDIDRGLDLLGYDEHGKYWPEDDTPPDAPKRKSFARQVVLTSASEIRSARVRWAWTNRIPLRSLVVVAGEPGLGKSLLTNAWLPAQLTRGTLDGELHGQVVDVAVASAEDDWETVVKPRLMAHGADLGQCTASPCRTRRVSS